jgi:TonB-dependent SusC/RagA subfamily outer membrane receptor
LRTITGNPEALVVIDGSVSNATILSQLPPEIVESVNVIKGQQGAALYGELGSNGVIIVNTKRGSKLNKLRVSLNSAIDFESISFLPERQTTYGQGWATDSFDLGSGPITGYVPFENGGWGPAYSDPSMPSMVPVGLPQADGSFIMTPWRQ